MNCQDFEQEVLNSNICPKNFKEMYSVFKNAQRETLNTLKEFHRVCENNNVDYQVTFGSLIGLVRDGGQIPWDYDVDVFVPFNQKDKLINALKCDLNSDYYFYCPEVVPSCRHFIMRLAPKQYRTELLHVDVFYYTGTSNDEKLRKEHAAKLKKVARARYYKLVNAKEESVSTMGYLKKLFFKFPYVFTSVTELSKTYEALCCQYPLEDAEIYLQADIFAGQWNFTRELMKETRIISVDAGEFRIPVNFDALLKGIYGNYMKIPPLEKRLKEIEHFYKRYNKFFK